MSEGGPATPTRTVLLVGNPNVGKTSLFNRLTGERARVGNYPGITVERRAATLLGQPTVELVDVPGAYSLTARSAEEQVAIDAVLGLREAAPALVIAVLDATQLVRSAFLALQLAELGVPMIVAVNLIDEVGEAPRTAPLETLLHVPALPVSARTGAGVDALLAAISAALETPKRAMVSVPYPAALRSDVDALAEQLPKPWRGSVERDRALARWALASLDAEDELREVPPELRRAAVETRARATAAGRDLELELTGSRWAVLDELESKLAQHDSQPSVDSALAVDRVLLHPVWGFAVFLLLMGTLFQALFWWSDPVIKLLEAGIGALGGWLRSTLPASVLTDLLVEGVVAGVGNVIVFLPQIALLFLFLGLLEDSGYMARVAFLMDRIMRSVGLHGRAFVPMLSGNACAVPAILATRTMERKRDRLLVMLVIPLMTCSARLPVYSLIIGALFPPAPGSTLPTQSLLLVAMYLFSTLTALAAAGVLGRTVLRGRSMPLVLELPPYRWPALGATLRLVLERSVSFLREAGTVILVLTIALWALLSFPKLDPPLPGATTLAPAAERQRAIEHSAAGRLGKALEPAIAPLGFDWKIGVGLIGAFGAREVFVATMGLVEGIGEVEEDDPAPLRDKLRSELRPDGKPRYTPLVGLSLMVFFALACQCMSTLSVVYRETRSWRWPVFLFAYMTVLAYGASFLVYQGGRLLGWS